MKLILGLVYSAVDGIHRGRELSTNYRVLKRILDKSELRSEVLKSLSGTLDLSCEVNPHDEVVDLVRDPLDGFTNEVDRRKK